MEILNQLTDFILSELGEDREVESIAPDDDLIKGGIVDSMGVLQVVNFIEQTYGIQVADEDITVENFRTIQAIARLIGQKRAV
jgi:acyl carrier protein